VRRRTRVAVPLLVVVGLALLATSGLMVVAAEGEATIPALTEVAQVGVLVGDPAGAYSYYEVAYPGGNTEVAIQLRFSPNDPVLAKAVGFNVYGPDSEESGEPKEKGAYLECIYAADGAATLLVQVYNYVASPVTYEIVAKGIPAPVAEEAAPSVPEAPEAVTPTTAEEAEVPVEEAEVPMAGEIVGSNAGAFAVHPIAGAGDGRDVTVTMTFSPDDPAVAKAVGFEVYSPTGKCVATGTPTRTVGQRVATFSAGATGDYTVQVYNYLDGLPLSYSLEIAD